MDGCGLERTCQNHNRWNKLTPPPPSTRTPSLPIPKVSNIHVLPREEALGFVANIMNEEEAVGVELQQPASAARPKTPRGGRRASNGGGRGGEGVDEMDVDGEDEEGDEEEEEDVEDEEEGEGGGRRASADGKRRRVRGGEQVASLSR